MRWEYYRRELEAFWARRDVTPQVHVVPWTDVVERDGRLEELAAPDVPSLLRLESPARDFEVIRRLMQCGERAEGQPPGEWQPPAAEGWIASPRLIYRGLCRVLEGIEASCEANSQLVPTADPRHVAVLFDKNQTADRLEAAGVPVPPGFRPTGSVDDLMADLKQRRWTETFVKLAYGSCASGIAVVQPLAYWPAADTTVAELDGRFHNTQHIRHVIGADLWRVIEFLLSQHATVQRSIPKLRVDGLNFDVRVVVIRGSIAGTVFRVSPHPMTNLHLGGHRGDEDACRRMIPQRQWLDGLDCAVEAAGLFDLPAVGVDLAFDRRDCSPCVLEANAFGDFFPNWVNREERSIHECEIAATAQHFGLLC